MDEIVYLDRPISDRSIIDRYKAEVRMHGGV